MGSETRLSASGGAPTPPHGCGDEDELTRFEISCDNYAPLLTALFDDEATSEEEHIARLHLERCDHCAQMWRDWENSQLIWRAMPAAKLPTGLLLRILTACRVAAMRPKFGLKNNNARRAVARWAPPLAGLFPEVAPPANLQEEILRRTVYAASRDAAHNCEYSHRRSPLSWTRQISRWGVAVAVPASLMWMMFLSDAEQSVWQTTQTPQPNKALQNAPDNNRLAQKPNTTRLSANSIAKTKVSNSPRLAVTPEPSGNARSIASENPTPENSPTERVAVADAPVFAAVPKPQVVSTHNVSTPRDFTATAIARPSMPLSSASVQFAAMSVPVKTSQPKALPTGDLAKSSDTSAKATPRRVMSTRRATSRAKIERAVVRSASRERLALLARPALRSERRTPGPSVSAPDVVLASANARTTAAETRFADTRSAETRASEARNSAVTTTAAEAAELEMDDTVRFASSETEELHAMLNEYQDALLSEEDAGS